MPSRILLAQHSKSVLNLVAGYILLAQHPKSALSLVAFLIFYLLFEAQTGKKPMATPPEISHGRCLSLSLSLSPKHDELCMTQQAMYIIMRL